MNFFRLRFLNTFLLLVLGVFFGFLLGRSKIKFINRQDDYKPVYPSSTALEQPVEQTTIPPLKASATEKNNGADNPMDDSEEYVFPVETPETRNQGPKDAAEAKDTDDTVNFIKNPKVFSGKNVSVKMQMITAKRKTASFRINMVYSDDSKNLNYLYVDDLDAVSGENPDFKIGYFYKARFYCGSGDLEQNNRLLDIKATGEKTPWASGISAIEN